MIEKTQFFLSKLHLNTQDVVFKIRRCYFLSNLSYHFILSPFKFEGQTQKVVRICFSNQKDVVTEKNLQHTSNPLQCISKVVRGHGATSDEEQRRMDTILALNAMHDILVPHWKGMALTAEAELQVSFSGNGNGDVLPWLNIKFNSYNIEIEGEEKAPTLALLSTAHMNLWAPRGQRGQGLSKSFKYLAYSSIMLLQPRIVSTIG